MKNVSHLHRLMSATIGLLMMGVVAQTSASDNDQQAISELRTQLEQAYLSGRTEDIGALLVEDYVYIQDNLQGPDTYGKKYFLDYWPSMEKITEIKIEPANTPEVFGNWAVEHGEMHMKVMIAGEPAPRLVRFFRVLNKEADGWKYARELSAVAEDQRNYKAPPRPGSITYAGKAHWVPRPSPEPNDSLIAMEVECRRAVIAKRDPSNHPLTCMWDHDLSYKFTTDAGVITWGDYIGWRMSEAVEPYDELEKYYKEVIVEGDFGFAWGHSVASGSNLQTGRRWGSIGTSLYAFRLNDEGKWKIFTGFNTIVVPE